MKGSKSCLVLSLWAWMTRLSTLEAQRSFANTVNLNQLCPAFLSSNEITVVNNEVTFRTAILPLADERAVVFPCQLKTEKPIGGNEIISKLGSPDISIVIHYYNVTSSPDNYSSHEFKPCRSFVNFKQAMNLDSKSCNFHHNLQQNVYKQFVHWSNEENSLLLNLNPHQNVIDAKYLQIYITLLSESFHTCRIQQYDLSMNSSTSCSSIDLKSRLSCVEFDCKLFSSGRFQSLLNTTYIQVKVLRVSEDEITRVIVATICPVLIVSSVVLLACAIISCKSSFAKKHGIAFTENEEETSLSRTDSGQELQNMDPGIIKKM